jgi:hypothetical protein
MQQLNPVSVDEFLAIQPAPAVRYPDVARMIADWIGAGQWQDVEELSRLAWDRTVSDLPSRR